MEGAGERKGKREGGKMKGEGGRRSRGSER